MTFANDEYGETGAEAAERCKRQSTEFKSFEDMTAYDLAFERKQKWVIMRSSHSWWIMRNDTPFMPCNSEGRATFTLDTYGITYAVIRTEQPNEVQALAEMRRDKMRLMNGRGPSVARRVWRWFGGDAA